MNAQTAQPTAAQPSAQPHTNGTLSLNEQLALVCKERDEANARAQQAEKAAKEAREAAAHTVGKPSVKARRTDRKYVDGKTGEEVPGKGNVAVYGLQRMGARGNWPFDASPHQRTLNPAQDSAGHPERHGAGAGRWVVLWWPKYRSSAVKADSEGVSPSDTTIEQRSR